MSVESVLAVNVAEAQDVQAALSSTPCSVDWEQYWPSDAGTDEADDEKNPEEAEEEVAIDGIVVEDEGVRFRPIAWNPAKGSFFGIIYSIAMWPSVGAHLDSALTYCSTGMMLRCPRVL